MVPGGEPAYAKMPRSAMGVLMRGWGPGPALGAHRHSGTDAGNSHRARRVALACEIVGEDYVTRSKTAHGAIADPDFHLPRENKNVLSPGRGVPIAPIVRRETAEHEVGTRLKRNVVALLDRQREIFKMGLAVVARIYPCDHARAPSHLNRFGAGAGAITPIAPIRLDTSKNRGPLWLPCCRTKWDLALGFFRRPAIRLCAGAAHQHRPLGVAEAVSLQEGLDSLLVVDDRKRARPVRAPQAALEPPGVEYAGQRVPDVRERIRLLRQRASAGDLDHRILALGEFHHFGKIGPGLRRRRRYARLLDAHMVDM